VNFGTCQQKQKSRATDSKNVWEKIVNFGTCQQKQESRATDSKNVCEKKCRSRQIWRKEILKLPLSRQWLPKLPDLEERYSEIDMFRQ
jgi:hypothetical protein